MLSHILDFKFSVSLMI